ncbi:MarR family winged helix-turn-helix transcriptional regulator [Mycetocola zhadangensis]|uniref:MarR family transcriptional regulator n=1 Tax=Mycetocola zhadangensis TaxID=1164595 RepID=A0A3L7ISP7_9MICO|nr:MarR family transcriptional regulator [Mycetocola zhadangensis]RLQ81169.1 MarR family transcriptional regulator [Mycetocola zhadangensis]GGF05333.1 MarR family transcriptional regulator [Mycetocola zhadangensis]
MTPSPEARDPDVLALENQVCFALAVASRSVLSLYRPVLEPLGLTHPQYLVMLALWEQSPRSVKDLGRALQLEPATLSPLLKRLEAAGLVRRERSTVDERVLDITLTPAGRQLRDRAEAIPATIISELGMSIEELDTLRGTLHRVIGAATRA